MELTGFKAHDILNTEAELNYTRRFGEGKFIFPQWGWQEADMLLNKATDYGMRVMFELASQPPATRAVVDEIARRQQIPPAFISKVLVRLSQANLVRTYRGATGGAHLARPPEKINLLEVVEAMQGAIVLNDCNIEYPPCPLKATCPISPIWREAKVSLEGLLRRTTLADLLKAA